MDPEEQKALSELSTLAKKHGFWDAEAELPKDVVVCRTSSRFCLGVEHGDYNGTELFGVGTNRFIWMAFRPAQTKRIRLLSYNFPNDGIVEFDVGSTSALMTAEERAAASWRQFPLGVDYVLTKHGFALSRGFDAVIYGNIPGRYSLQVVTCCFSLLLCHFCPNAVMHVWQWAC